MGIYKRITFPKASFVCYESGEHPIGISGPLNMGDLKAIVAVMEQHPDWDGTEPTKDIFHDNGSGNPYDKDGRINA